MVESLEMYHFVHATKDQHLTLADIKHLNVGDALDVVIWDGNWEEYWAWEKAENLKPYSPEEFFTKNRHKLVYRGNLTWDIHFRFGEVIEHPVHLNTEHLQTYCRWCAVDEKDGKIHITSEYLPRGQDKIPICWRAKHIHWTKFPETTRVGWRGPIMLWEKLKNCPQVYLQNGYYGEDLEKKSSKRFCVLF